MVAVGAGGGGGGGGVTFATFLLQPASRKVPAITASRGSLVKVRFIFFFSSNDFAPDRVRRPEE
jgi:hypothetical protein